MANEPLLTNDQARRQWLWICQRVGEQAARAAIAQIKGARKPFPFNVAKVLQIELPEDKYLPVLDEEKAQIHQKSRQILGDALKMLSGKG